MAIDRSIGHACKECRSSGRYLVTSSGNTVLTWPGAVTPLSEILPKATGRNHRKRLQADAELLAVPTMHRDTRYPQCHATRKILLNDRFMVLWNVKSCEAWRAGSKGLIVKRLFSCSIVFPPEYGSEYGEIMNVCTTLGDHNGAMLTTRHAGKLFVITVSRGITTINNLAHLKWTYPHTCKWG